MDADGTQFRRYILGGIRSLLAALALVPAVPATGAETAEPKVAFDIPAGELSETVVQFYKQSYVEILYYSPDGVAGIKTQAVSGKLEPSVALARMLEGTGFTFTFDSPRSALLRRRDDGQGRGVAD